MLLTQKRPVIPTSKLVPRNEINGYDLVTSDSLSTPNGFKFVREKHGTETTGVYGIIYEGKRIGEANLSFGLNKRQAGRREVGFDIAVTERGRNLGALALGGLASTLDVHNFDLVTADVKASSQAYWDHLAAKGDVVPVDTAGQYLKYQVVPIVPIEPPMH